jgi:hypothetical protein
MGDITNHEDFIARIPWIDFGHKWNGGWDEITFCGENLCQPGVEVEIERRGKFLIGHINKSAGAKHGVGPIYDDDIVLRYRVLVMPESLMAHE